MIKLLKLLRETFFELTWIKTLIQEEIISSAMGRAIEGTIFSFYAGIITFVISGLNTGDWTNLKATITVLLASLGVSVLEAVLKAIRDRKDAR